MNMRNGFDTNKIKALYWKEGCNIKEISNRLGLSFWPLYGFMTKEGIMRRSRSEVNYIVNKNKPKFKIKNKLNINEQKLKIAGIMLYWAEGTLKGCTVDFANSNPQMVKIFLKFLREICGVSEERLRVYLYGYSYQNLEQLKNYWSNVTGISISQFTKPYIRVGSLNISNRKLQYGLVHIRYNDKKLLETIKNWIEEYVNNFKWVGAGVVNRTRLYLNAAPQRNVGVEKWVNSGKPL